MGMGTRRRRQRQEQIWIAHQEVSKGPPHPFYAWVNELLEEKNFDEFAEKESAKFYADSIGRPSWRRESGDFWGSASTSKHRIIRRSHGRGG